MKFALIWSACAISLSSVSCSTYQKNSISLDHAPKIKVMAQSRSELRAELEGLTTSALDLKWDHSAESILKMAQEFITMANETISRMLETKGARTYENTVVPLAAFETWVA